MTEFQTLDQAGVMALVGMGVIFGFLLILFSRVSAKGKAAREKKLNTAAPEGPPSFQPGVTVNNAALTAAITAAVNEYRKNNM